MVGQGEPTLLENPTINKAASVRAAVNFSILRSKSARKTNPKKRAAFRGPRFIGEGYARRTDVRSPSLG